MRLFLKRISCLSLFLMFIFTLVGCDSKEPVSCEFFFINPENEEYIKPHGMNVYDNLYLTYDGEQKQIEVVTVRCDNDKEVRMLDEIEIVYTYNNPKTGEKEYDKPYMLEKGEYFLVIKNCKFNEKKWYISTYVSFTIYIQ